MKKIAIVSVLTTLFAGSVFAADVHVPFIYKSVPADGLTVSYDTSYGSQRVVCVADNFYKGYLFITQDGAEKDAGIAYGGGSDGEQFYFTAKGEDDVAHGEDLHQYRVDSKATFTLKNGPRVTNARVSCFYMPETSAAAK